MPSAKVAISAAAMRAIVAGESRRAGGWALSCGADHRGKKAWFKSGVSPLLC